MQNTKIYERKLYDKRSEEELRRYSSPTSKIVYEYWDKKLISMLSLSKNSVVLDCGCGLGMLSSKISSKLVVGIDISKKLLKVAKKNSKNVFVIADAEKLPFKDKIFDNIVGRGILHHLPKPSLAAKEIKRVLDPNGVIVFSEPNDANLLIRIIRRGLKMFESSYSEEQTYFDPADMKKLFANSETSFFGYLSYPFAFPDIFPSQLPSSIINFFIQADKLLSRIPLINTFSWHVIIKHGGQQSA